MRALCWQDQQFWNTALAAANVSAEHIFFAQDWRYRRFEHSKEAQFCAPRPTGTAIRPVHDKNDPCARKLQQRGKWVWSVACWATRWNKTTQQIEDFVKHGTHSRLQGFPLEVRRRA
jgi:hypothetical protein